MDKKRDLTIRLLAERLGNERKRRYEVWVDYPKDFKPSIFAIFEVDKKYELLDYLGGGSLGMVCSAKDKSSGEKVAIKKIADVFRHQDYTERAMREVLIHSQIHHPFIVGFREVMQPVDKINFNDIYIVMEIANENLEQFITRSKTVGIHRAAPLNVKLIMNQLFRAFQYLQSGDVLHRDLKLDNILIKDNETVKLCNFGISRISAPRMTETVIVDSYKPPELFLRHISNQSNYGPAIDVWSLGCIFADILLQRRFSLGFGDCSNDIDNMKMIAQTIPPPNDDDLSEMIDDEEVRLIVKSWLRPLTLSRPLSDIFVDVADKSAVDLLEKMLVFNPRKRISMADALEHEYMAEITVDVLAGKLKLTPYQIETLKGLNPPHIDMSVLNHSESSKKIIRKILFDSCMKSQAAQTLVNISTK